MENYLGETKPSNAAAGNRCDAAVARSYSASFCDQTQTQTQMKKSRSVRNAARAVTRSWSFNDPELQRKRRVAGYKVYSVEHKMKLSFKKSFKWFKHLIGV
ncbi:PREDICTED: uncharacterized protein LOC104810357 [Tarenaya hassleriana]|uniref:uncharacterized protein LOC104810357 n=1 Tax=Tarenaya hassleriana TaxID=28532 RepID=UPI00053C0E89|nr:PREDICTED: uncharacterized protein LOC104810357 [Tarenaya hassleriana]